jgi:hypothetical protein
MIDAFEPPRPPENCPELGLILRVAAETIYRGDGWYEALYEAVASAWAAGHVEGEDHCRGCAGRDPARTDWQARQDAVLELCPDASNYFDYREFLTMAFTGESRAAHQATVALPHVVSPSVGRVS